jgi:hypothetical protein
MGLPKSAFEPPKPLGPKKTDRRELRLVGLAAACLVLLVYLLSRDAGPGADVGGLDGCLRTPAGAPLVAEVRVHSQAGVMDADGCFFFSALPAGTQTLEVKLPSGTWQRSVTIVAREAVGLGNVVVNPAEVHK